MKKLCFVALLTPLAFAACKKNEKPVPESTPDASARRIIEQVFIKNDSAVYIPLKPGDSVRQWPAHKLAVGKPDPGSMAVCQPAFSIISQTGSNVTIQATVCFSVMNPSYTDWYLNDGTTRVAYLGTTGSGVLTFPPFSAWLTCGKSYALEAAYHYTDAAGIPRIGINYSLWYWTAGVVQVAGLGVVDDGADVKITDINGNGVPDLVLMTYDDAPGANSFKYKFLRDVSTNGTTADITSVVTVTGLGVDGAGAGVVVEDINGNGIKDMIIMAYDDPSGANTFRYRVGLDLNANGEPAAGWPANYHTVTGLGDLANGAGIAMWDIDQNGVKDIILMAYVDPSGANIFRYKIGYNPNAAGYTANWSGYVSVPGVGDHGHGAGFDVRDIDGNGYPEFFFLAYDDAPGENSFRYRVVHNVNTSGNGVANANYITYRGVGEDGYGAGIALGDLNADGNLDMILMADDNTPGNVANTFRYRIGYNLPASANGITPYNFWCGY